MTRYALYFAPAPDSEFHRFGSAWLGRDAYTGAVAQSPTLDRVPPERVAAITASPRHYGFHATLKPPFSLAAGRSAGELHAALEDFAAGVSPFAFGPLQLAEIAGFLALVPTRRSAELERFAERSVRNFDPFRAPASREELARRSQAPLDRRERELLDAWGYPYVLDRWRFHMTLTERLDAAEREQLTTALEPLVAPFCRELVRVDALALFVQPERDAAFQYECRFALAGAPLLLGGE